LRQGEIVTDKRSKAKQRKVRELVALAHERELTMELENLLQQFHRWKNNGIDAFELNEIIHEFHNGISRTLYNRYTGRDAAIGVAFAFTRDILSREEIGEEVFTSIAEIAKLFSSRD
jgi:hypothetical protein